MRKGGGEAGTIKTATAQLVGEHPLTAGTLQRINPEFQILHFGGDPCVTQQYLSQNSIAMRQERR